MRLIRKKYRLFSIITGLLCCLYLAISSAPTFATSSVSIATPATIDLELLPTTTGATSVGTSNVTITTSDTENFKVFLNSTSTDLSLANSKTAQNIPSITASATLEQMPVNTWGIYFGAQSTSQSTLYSPITTAQTEVASNPLADASGTYKLAVALKANTALPAGIYRNDLVISVVATPKPKNDLSEISFMQDVTPELCANSELERTYILVDKRDNKEYKVARLKDGNCWMQENLKLTFGEGEGKVTTLTPDDSDVKTDWTPSKTETTPTNNTNYNGIKSWNIGQNWYYEFNAATAGTGQSVNDAEAESSICPKGWRLPAQGIAGVSADATDSFNKLLSAYNYTITSPYTNFSDPPLNFSLGGMIYDGYNNNVGTMGYYWSRNAGASTHGYGFSFGTQNSLSTSRRYRGFAVRCVTKGVI